MNDGLRRVVQGANGRTRLGLEGEGKREAAQRLLDSYRQSKEGLSHGAAHAQEIA